MKTVFIFVLVWYFAGVVSAPPIVREMTTISGVTESPEARKSFEQGMLLLHNFEYPDAADLFRKAQTEDPLFALAYWGEAMTYNHPIWLSQDLDEARNVLKKYKEISARQTKKLPSLDADLMRSLDLLYGEGSKQERDKAYAAFMSSLYEKNKSNHDVATFYALSLLGEAGGWNQDLCNRAAEIAGAVLKQEPEHPGALHYFIHAQDHPEFARYAWDQANKYASVASYSGHALHMPSHIYLALGKWDDVVKSNEVSWQAGVDRKESRKLTNNALNYHAHWWLAYGYMQQGRMGKALDVVNAQLAFTRDLPSPQARNHFVIMRGHYLIESNDWENQLTKESLKTEDLRIEIRNLDRFVKGLKAFRGGDEKLLRTLIMEIETDLKQTRQVRSMNEGIAQCGATPYAAGLTQASILLEELKALEACMKKDLRVADEHFRKAIALEDENGHFFGPPEILKPTNEFYGEFLLANNRADEAIRSFETSLRKAPGRNQSLRGLAQSLSRAGQEPRAREINEALRKRLQGSDLANLEGFFPTP